MLLQIVSALGVVVAAVVACSAYFYFSNKILDFALPVKDGDIRAASRNLNRRAVIRPWLFLGPALFLLFVYLVYPVVATFILSFYDRTGQQFVGVANYKWAIGDREFRQSIFNNILWLAVVPAACTFFGLVIAVMTDRIWWGNIAKSIVFMPMAISFVGASVIWKFIYEYRGGNDVQIGLLNAIVQLFGGTPEVWISVPFWNNFFLMIILIWIQTGFAMVILSAALRGIPEETIEAAVIDGANGWQIFWRIMVPQVWGTIAVVWTTITILVLKVFDIVLTMTNGQWQTMVLANLMFNWLFRGGGDSGRSAVIAIIIMLAVTPIMIWNVRRANRELKGH
ncbi:MULTISPECIES: carbohydrate ABC transporter permease [Rhizobium]|uniref:carbohydrate ABC transporter permease n=1 Tax=Rhizobium TaxID=379 RepID=UPI0007EAC964|nr:MULTISPECIES: sugar ABC transporter permease [Rhizobium]ANK90257.1 alpha-glucoside ABC transporter permease protein AglF [Rhizobium sp. N6212]ANK96284.1 alpha-glucoside ABC transporter permease protein AglF [Rhizobium sp. N621]ANL02328.1 alpha-glucoside ABC transporter permease protein AglF [Rhizobium esperanzae]ANL08456.1 alpha-glucoside ABC transporter permease protein AglF [Rhizobium sp. N1341]ANL20504.1 alpha-glucoside ABC transporter permease protein AglF [Rhizobium sp. N113]